MFEFDDRGHFAGLTAQRYNAGRSLETWVIPVTEWKTIRGIEMPVRGGVVWKLVETNRPTLWGED